VLCSRNLEVATLLDKSPIIGVDNTVIRRSTLAYS